ncbi:uncharacterized protein LOC108738129 [Agrilus planipennis]|uniref:Uncharacterized protein LOC108738129 n=1 Tax=Agrilus planipennis TaxID=224129 RepID=A0A7F5RBR9_AGRPL|nr:uncharacterized protein LOC108738129 [Agrilus planipennis]
MDGTKERETEAFGGIFQQIIQDMKNGMPLWEDLIAKATKLHSTLRAAIQAIAAYLEAFQKIADSATSARDYKRARAELKKRSTDTLRLQKKYRKGTGGDLQKRIECCLQDVNEKRQVLEETEKRAVRAALLEERSRFCCFVGFLKPVVHEEVAMLTELSHLQEVVEQLEKHTADPQILPPASEQVIADLKSSDSGWSFQTPPSSPSSLGSRKSSMCSISSLNSSSSGSSKNHSPSHPHWQRSLSQNIPFKGTMRLASVCSQDSGFTSQDTLYPRPPSSLSVAQVSNLSEHSPNSSNGSTPCTPFSTSAVPTTTATWPNLQETMQFERAACAIMNERPHTISSAYEKGHQRPPLTVYTFQAPDQSLSQPASPVTTSVTVPENKSSVVTSQKPGDGSNSSNNNETNGGKNGSKPPLPTRCSSLERPNGPNVPAKTIKSGVRVLPPSAVEIKLSKSSHACSHIIKDIPQPTYVNMHDLASMAASKVQETNLPPPPAEFTSTPTTEKGPNENDKDGISTSESSLESSSGYGSQTTFITEEIVRTEDLSMSNLETAGSYCTLPRNGDHLTSVRRRPLSMTAMYSSVTGPGGVGSNFIATLSAKLAPTLSPRSSRRHVDDSVTMMANNLNALQQQQNKLAQRGLAGQNFLDSLNAKLAQQQNSNNIQCSQIKANKVRQIINSKAQPDPKQCHESLMDQIKKGATLRRAKIINDRSAPKIF